MINLEFKEYECLKIENNENAQVFDYRNLSVLNRITAYITR